jgi:CRISPR-associated protein Cmr4
VTSPLVRARLDRKARLAGVSAKPADGTGAAVGLDGPECLAAGKDQTQFVLGPYTVSASHDAATENWAHRLAEIAFPGLEEMAFFKQKLATDLYVCSDELLGAISRDCAPIATRVQLGTGEDGSAPRKTVQHGPFQSEYLPAESMLAALLECDSDLHLSYVCGTLNDTVLRLGGDETLGKGLLWCHLLRQGAGEEDPQSERPAVTAAP